MTDFSDVPQSITELRARKEDDGRKWTPRDVLIYTLRQIDKGEVNPDCLVVVLRRSDEDGFETDIIQSAPDTYILAGTLAKASHRVNSW